MVVHSFGVNEHKGIEKSNTIFEKAKKPVEVTRNGKTFIQMREEKKPIAEEFQTYTNVGKYLDEMYEATGMMDPNDNLIRGNASRIEVGDKDTFRIFDKHGNKLEVKYGGAGLDKPENDKVGAFMLDATPSRRYEKNKQQVFEYLENHDVVAGDVTFDMIEDANEIMELGLSGSEVERIAKQYRQKKIADVCTNVQEKMDDEYDKAHEKKDKSESLQLGVKNLKSNLQSRVDYFENLLKTNSAQSEFPDKITEGKIYGLKTAIELLNDGLKHLL